MSYPDITIDGMFVEHFSRWRAERHACWHCIYFDGLVVGGALCRMPLCCRLRSQPEGGCAQFEREIGSDDEPEWMPPVVRSPGERVWRVYPSAT